MALFWYNFTPAGALPNEDTNHAGCPVLVGHKWGEDIYFMFELYKMLNVVNISYGSHCVNS